ncbi:caspase family protein [Micromonospora haikouensis]|uniref:caspase family protein n=1 Tax=Micromonospora haikouensis TaxID=686309 RepID=UPI003D756F4E
MQTAAVILGASSWPGLSNFAGSNAFSRSANRLREYLTSKNGLHLDASQVLWLFDSDCTALEQYDAMRAFAQEQLETIGGASHSQLLMIAYYIGHGAVFGVGQFSQYCLLIRGTVRDLEPESSLRVKALAGVMQRVLPDSPRLFVLDCCYAARALPELQSSGQQQLNQAAAEVVDSPSASGGVSLVCASGTRSVTTLRESRAGTAFTDAALDVLARGDGQNPGKITPRRLYELTKAQLPPSLVPEIHSPKQTNSEVADLPVFPNRSRRSTETQPDPGRMRDLAADRLLRIFAPYERRKIFVHPRIPLSKVKQIRDQFDVEPGESIICIIQTYGSWSLGGVSGLTVTDWGVHFRNFDYPYVKCAHFSHLEFSKLSGMAEQYSWWAPVSGGIVPLRHTAVRVRFSRNDEPVYEFDFASFGKREDLRVARFIAALPDYI